MDYGEYLRGLKDCQVTLGAQQRAQELIAEFRAPTHMDRAGDAGGSVLRALGKDIIDLTTGLPLRVKAYRLHRDLGLSTMQAICHSSPEEGLAAAALVVLSQDRQEY